MNIFKKVNLLFSARGTCKHKQFYTASFDPDLKIAPYVVSAVLAYNKDVRYLLYQTKYPAYKVSDKGVPRKCRATLHAGTLKTEETVDRLRSDIEKKDMLMKKERQRLQEQRLEAQQRKKPHLVQQYNDQEDKLVIKHASEILELHNLLRKVVSTQICSLAEAENRISARLDECVEENHRFYTALPEFGFREQLRLLTIKELQQVVPLQEFPKEYRDYKKEMETLYSEHEHLADELRRQLGI